MYIYIYIYIYLVYIFFIFLWLLLWKSCYETSVDFDLKIFDRICEEAPYFVRQSENWYCLSIQLVLCISFSFR